MGSWLSAPKRASARTLTFNVRLHKVLEEYMITTFLTMLMLAVFFALIRIAVYVIQDKLGKNAPPPVTEEDKKMLEAKYEAIRRKILFLSIGLMVIGGIAGNYGIDNDNDFLFYTGAFILLCGCIGIIARTMIAPVPTK